MIQKEIKTGNSVLKNSIVKAGFFALARGCESTSHFDEGLKEELQAWPESYTIMLKVAPSGQELWLQKKGSGLKWIAKQDKEADLIVLFKNLETAYQIITTQSNVHTAFSQNRIMVYGDIAQSMVLIRVLNIVQAYLFPPFLSKNVLKRVPKFSIKEHIGRARVYTIGLALGK